MLRTSLALFVGGMLFSAPLMFLPAQAGAQVNFGQSGVLTISANPAYPTPGSTVELTVESPLLDLSGSDIEWSVNGNAAGSGQSIKVPLGGLGQETDVDVSVSGTSGSDETSIAIVPTSIDLLYESNSYVPPFYQGRAVPTSGSMIRVLAVPHFVESDGTAIAPSDIDFTWKLNNAVDKAQSGVGESSAEFPAAVLYDTDVITVDAQTPDGTLSGEGQISIRTGAPQLELYEDSPLFGVTYYQALGQSSTAGESETSFAAVPYFADAVSANDQSLAYAWNVNGSPIATDLQDPSEITIGAQSSGTAQISLSVTKPSDPFFSASGAWTVTFSNSTPGNNVFQNAQTSNSNPPAGGPQSSQSAPSF